MNAQQFTNFFANFGIFCDEDKIWSWRKKETVVSAAVQWYGRTVANMISDCFSPTESANKENYFNYPNFHYVMRMIYAIEKSSSPILPIDNE